MLTYYYYELYGLFIAPLARMRHFEFKILLVQLPVILSFEFPGRYEAEVCVIPFGFPILCLHFFPEMTSAALPALKRIDAHQLSQFDEIGHATRFVQLGIELHGAARHPQVTPELGLERTDLFDGRLEPGLVTRHAAFVPHDLAQALVKAFHALGTVDIHELADPCRNGLFSLLERRMRKGNILGADLIGQVITERIRDDEISVG